MVYIRSDAVSLLPDTAKVNDRYGMFLQYFQLLMLLLPSLIGMFVGAPLIAREVEHGTHVFGLTQSVSRTRWLVTKLAMAGGSLALAMFTLGLVTAWALAPLNYRSARMEPPIFEVQGLTVGVYALLAFAVGATAGLMLRNTLAAMVLTLAVCAVFIVVIGNAVRPHFAEPMTMHVPIETRTSMRVPDGSWSLSYGYLDASGRPIELDIDKCALAGRAFVECAQGQGAAEEFVRYHPADRFWQFQFIEFGLYILLSAGVLAAGAWASRRRLI
nr:ABC transporter permease subunit [Kibdelosporangium phytohabitans]